MSYKPLLLQRLVERDGRGTYRGHMPGHKGKPLLPSYAERLDFTELCDTGNLYDAEENILREAERGVAAELGADDCVYCAGGSTLLIQAALATANGHFKRPPRVLAARDAHRSFFSAMALLGGEVDFLYPEYGEDGISRGISVRELEHELIFHSYNAVYVTAPNYYGSMCGIRETAGCCAAHNVPLIIDAAHGAHIVCSEGGHPFGLDTTGGIDAVTIFSAHKTLEAMGGAAFALISGDWFFTKELMLKNMQLFGSSSPSYAILASLDLALSRALSDEGRAAILGTAERADALRRRLADVDGVRLPSCRAKAADALSALFTGGDDRPATASDHCRLVVGFDAPGHAAAEWLERERGVVCEMADERWVIFILTAADDEADFARLESAIVDCAAALRHGVVLPVEAGEPPRAERVMSIRDAYFSSHRSVLLADAEGEVAAETVAPYPPGVPVIAPGEKITAKTLSFLRDKCYNMDSSVRVVRTNTENKEENI